MRNRNLPWMKNDMGNNPKYMRLLRISFLALGCWMLFSNDDAIAQSFTISNGVTETTTRILGDGETGTIEQGGTLDTRLPGGSGGNGIFNNNIFNNQTVNVMGTVIGQNFGVAIGQNSTVLNSGLIQGVDADGLSVLQNSNVTNSGTLSSLSNSGDGLQAGSESQILNTSSGQIEGAWGVHLSRSGSTFTNEGIVRGNRFDGVLGDRDMTIVNSGQIFGATGGGGSPHAAIDLDFGTVINTGLLQGETGVEIDRDNPGDASVVNGGRIVATGRAIDFQGTGNDSLTILQGSTIEGGIFLGGGTDTFVVEQGVSLIYTFDTALPEIIDTKGRPFIVDGLTVIVVDPSLIGQASQQDDVLGDLTSGIFNSVHTRLSGINGGGNGGLSALPGGESLLTLSAAPSPGKSKPNEAGKSGSWGQAFSGYRNLEAASFNGSSSHEYLGGIFGVDGWLNSSLQIGGFGGGAQSELSSASSMQEFEADHYFGGAYANIVGDNWFIRALFTAGHSDYESEGTSATTTSGAILNNLAAGGSQSTAGMPTSDGTFISPEVAIGANWSLGWIGIEPSARLRYAHLSLDGSSGNAGAIGKVRTPERDVSLWLGRAQIAFPIVNARGVLSPRVGVEAWNSESDDISSVVLGQTLTFAADDNSDDVTGFAGVTALTKITENVQIFADAEIHISEDQFSRTEVRTGLKANW